MTGTFRPRAHSRGGGDQGAVHAPVAVALAALTLPLLALLFGAGLFSTHGASGGCGLQAAAQPGASDEARTGIPHSYLRLYQDTGRRYGLAWNLLAAIGKVESDHGRDPGPGVRSGANYAGAAGPMQIGIGGAAGNTWGGAPRHRADQHTGGFGVDGNGDGWADVHDPADAIPAAARYLLAHGAPADPHKALFAYNPDTSYARAVLAQAARYADGPPELAAVAGTGLESCPGQVAAYAAVPGDVAAKVIAYARAQIGKPYVYGDEGPHAFDCSGLTMRAYQAAGITIPRTSQTQYRHGPRIPAGTEQPGDLVFFAGSRGTPTAPGHVGIVIGGGRMIEARCSTCGPIATAAYTSRDPVAFTRPAAHSRR
ncbi:NlpC/P60 family protein [Actinomadura sp. 6K520]|uniref:C40 family peptidase n=1 Tax=Actinomadura sp. 6K520 TaxID=2530364 RepID=UPI00104A4880|nr:NlpC/P60 family protein [Actinomadura sp. 6K520]TDE22817.1 hydrolase [Actinomadura sp. 6K520]